MPERARGLAALLLLLLALGAATAADVRLPALRGFVTDEAGVLSPAEEATVTARIERLQRQTGAEIAVVTVPTTAPLDDFDYAMRIAEKWRPGHAERDTGVVVLLATEDRRLRVLVGYGLEGILPDGLVGEIQDRTMVPELRAGRPGAAVVAGVEALADRIERGLAGEASPPPARRRAPGGIPAWAVLLVILVVIAFMVYEARTDAHRFRGGRRRRRGPFILPFPGGFGGRGGGFGGFGGGGGGFGGFGGGSFGGGGAGRSW